MPAKPTTASKKAVAKTSTTPPPAATSAPYITEEEIRERAYAIYLSEGRPAGRDLDHWLAAESDRKVVTPSAETPESVETAKVELPAAKPAKAVKTASRKKAAS